jgi:lysozyme family protein
MSRTYRYGERWPQISEMIQRFKINPSREKELERTANAIITNKDRYIDVERASDGVPYPLLGVLHDRESSMDFNTYLGNGQRLNMRTTIEPDGRGPFCQTLPATQAQFKAGCLDALKIDGLIGVRQDTDRWEPGRFWGSWPIEKMIFYAEKLNGLGYWYKGMPSPYIWGGSNIQVRGKYVSDGVFDPNEMDTQLGCAPILWMIGALDPHINYLRET